jgi:hypothetical protein
MKRSWETRRKKQLEEEENLMWNEEISFSCRLIIEIQTLGVRKYLPVNEAEEIF